jgi:hypothetical protein
MERKTVKVEPEILVLPDEEPLPKLFKSETLMDPGITHLIWYNTALKRFHKYARRNQASGLSVSMKDFAQLESGLNNPGSFRQVIGIAAKVIGYKWKPKHHPEFNEEPVVTQDDVTEIIAAQTRASVLRPKVGQTALEGSQKEP